MLYFPHSNRWDNNHNRDYSIPLPSDPIPLLKLLQREAPHVRLLLGRILGRENQKSWEMGMRLEFIQQLLVDYQPNESMLSLLEIYLQCAAQGYLPWRRHYDRQTYVLAPRILGLALKLSDMVSSYPHLLAFWRRMMKNLPSSSRNLQDIGSAIRLKILECKDHQNRIIYDQFVSEFHQKLHNASGPEDIAITRAYLTFLDSQGDLNLFLESLCQAGLAKKEEAKEEVEKEAKEETKEEVEKEAKEETKEEEKEEEEKEAKKETKEEAKKKILENAQKDGREVITPILDQYGDYRSIHHLPSYVAQKAEATRKVFQELLVLLQGFFGGMEIEEAIAVVLPRADSQLRQQLQDLLIRKERLQPDHSPCASLDILNLDILKQLSHLRTRINERILCSSLSLSSSTSYSSSSTPSSSTPSPSTPSPSLSPSLSSSPSSVSSSSSHPSLSPSSSPSLSSSSSPSSPSAAASALSGEEIRDLLHLELVLEDYAKALANSLLNDLPGQQNFYGISPEHLELLCVLLSHLSPCSPVAEPEVPVARQSLIQWKERMVQREEKKSRDRKIDRDIDIDIDIDIDLDWCLQGKAILDRLNRIILNQVSSRMTLYQPKAELLGRLLEIEPQAWQIFTEESLRNDWLFLLSRLVTLI